MSEYNLEARWVNLGEREPNHDDEVFARKTAEDFLTVIYFAEEGDIKYSINGESYIFDDQMDQWEWLELRPKVQSSEPAVPLPDGSNMKIGDHLIVEDEKTGEEQRFIISEETTVKGETLPDGTELRVETTKTIRDKMTPWESAPSIPLPGGGNIRVLRDVEPSNLAEMFRLQHHLNSRIGADMVDVAAVGDKEAIARWTQKFVTAMQQELAELVDCVPWKWWRPDEAQPYDRQNARVEIVDLFHFLISLAQLHGMSAEDVYNTYKAKCQINHKRQDSGYLQKDPDDCRGI